MKEITHILSVLLFMSGCSHPVYRFQDEKNQVEENRENLAMLEVGMSKQQVLAIMGDKTALRVGSKDKTFEMLYYHTDIKGEAGVITERRTELTPLVFDKGKLVGWGGNF